MGNGIKQKAERQAGQYGKQSRMKEREKYFLSLMLLRLCTIMLRQKLTTLK